MLLVIDLVGKLVERVLNLLARAFLAELVENELLVHMHGPRVPLVARVNPLQAATEFVLPSLFLGRKEEHRMTGLGILLLIVGLILWLTVMPAIGWILMAIGVVLIVLGLVLGMAWGFSRRTAPY